MVAFSTHTQIPYYSFRFNGTGEGQAGFQVPLEFPVPINGDLVSINEAKRQELLAAMVGVLETLNGVDSVHVVRVDHSEEDVTPPAAGA